MPDEKGGSESPAPDIGETLLETLSELREDAPEGQDADDSSADSNPASAQEDKSDEAPDDTEDQGGHEQGGETDEEASKGEDDDEEGEAAEDEPGADIVIPEHWPEEHKEILRGLPPEGQRFIIDRHREIEADNTRKSMELAELKRPLEAVKSDLNISGVSTAQFVQRMVGLHLGLKENPEEMIEFLAKQNGVDLSKGDESEDEDQDDTDDDMTPRERRLMKQVEKLTNLVEGRSTSDQNDALEQSKKEAASRIEAFKSEKDGKGNLLHPHFDEVSADISLLAQAAKLEGKAPDLAELYDKAVHVNPKTREKVLGKNGSEDSAEKKRKKVERARKASAGARGKSSATAKDGRREDISLLDELHETAKELAAKG